MCEIITVGAPVGLGERETVAALEEAHEGRFGPKRRAASWGVRARQAPPGQRLIYLQANSTTQQGADLVIPPSLQASLGRVHDGRVMIVTSSTHDGRLSDGLISRPGAAAGWTGLANCACDKTL